LAASAQRSNIVSHFTGSLPKRTLSDYGRQVRSICDGEKQSCALPHSLEQFAGLAGLSSNTFELLRSPLRVALSHFLLTFQTTFEKRSILFFTEHRMFFGITDASQPAPLEYLHQQQMKFAGRVAVVTGSNKGHQLLCALRLGMWGLFQHVLLGCRTVRCRDANRLGGPTSDVGVC
jgi:hypothetical protein